jgi:protein involved in polysaccharide export with SLBB domain
MSKGLIAELARVRTPIGKEGEIMRMKRGQMILLPALLGLALFAGGCASSGSAQRRMAAEKSTPVAWIEEEREILAGLESYANQREALKKQDKRVAYTVGPDDILRVEVRQHPDIGGDRNFRVTPEGTIFLSLIGAVDVEDATTGEIARRIEKQLEEFIREPEAAVAVEEYNSKKIYVLGQVRNPGEYPMRGNTLTVRDSVFLAGLPMDTAALNHVAVITPDEENPQVVMINLNDILYRGIMRSNIDLKPGDVVVVHRNLPAKIGAFLDLILGPTTRLRSLENIIQTMDGQ